MAVATYAVVIIALLLIPHLGLGSLNVRQWIALVALAMVINGTFYTALRSGANLRCADPSLTAPQIIASAVWGSLPLYAIPQARPLLLMFYLPAFSFGMLRLDRRSYARVVAAILALYGVVLVTELLRERPGFRLEYELFLFAIFGLVLLWFSYFGGFVSNLRARLGSQRRALQTAHDRLCEEMAVRARTAAENERLIADLQTSLARVKTLSGLLPICAACKKIRDDQGYWTQIEAYLRVHSNAELTHGICPECADRLYGQFAHRQ